MSSLIRLYPACYNGDIQAINAGSPDVHINLQYKKWTVVQKKWLRTTNHAHQTKLHKQSHFSVFFVSFCTVQYMYVITINETYLHFFSYCVYSINIILVNFVECFFTTLFGYAQLKSIFPMAGETDIINSVDSWHLEFKVWTKTYCTFCRVG